MRTSRGVNGQIPSIAGKRIVLLTASASRLGGGVAEAVIAHARMLRGLGAEPVVLALDDEHGEEDRPRYGDVPLRLVGVQGPRRFGYSRSFRRNLDALDPDLVHLHGIWMYPSKAALDWRRRTGKPLVISPHGMLAPWITARGRLQKAVARALYERCGWREASVMHALTRAEAKDIASESGRTDSAVIPNAAPVMPLGADLRPPMVLYLGRIHPKKNLGALLDGWDLADKPDSARLVIAGWGAPEDVAQLETRVASSPGAEFVGPVHGQAKEALVGEARFMVLPSLSEGLPMAILEAWAAGTPALMSEECNLPEGFTARAAIDCGTDASRIAAALTKALAIPVATWRKMSQAATGLAQGPFAPETVAQEWAALYARLMEDA